MSDLLLERLNTLPLETVFKFYNCQYIIDNAGRNSKCPLPPFHSTGKTPPFRWYPRTNSWSCFSCHKGGSVVQFVMHMESLTIKEALQKTLSIFGLSDNGLPAVPASDILNNLEIKQEDYLDKIKISYIREYFIEAKKVSLNDALKVFNILFIVRKTLSEDKVFSFCKEALSSVGDQLKIKNFLLNFKEDLLKIAENSTIAKISLSGLQEAEKFLNSRNLIIPEGFYSGKLKENSLILPKEFSGMENRILFPCILAPNYIVGFSGRVEGDFILKYYTKFSFGLKKGDFLFGLNRAIPSIIEEGKVFVVEGILDLFRLISIGINNVVATSGTFFTYVQASQLSVFTNKITFLFDGDAGGRTAYNLAEKTLKEFDIEYDRYILPEGEDPDSYGFKQKENFKETLLTNTLK